MGVGTGPDLGPDPVARSLVPPLRLRTGAGTAALAGPADPWADRSPGGLRDRAVGAVVGAAVGDALGAPFEFSPAGTFSARLPERHPDGYGDMIGGGPFDWGPGEFTDDTQMGLALAASLHRCDGYDPDDVWRRWQIWARTSSDVGNTTRIALGHRDWRDVRHRHPEATAANGALMRAFPLAPATLGCDVATARSVALHQALLTHAHPAAAWGAWLGVAMTRAGILGEDPLAALETELAVLARADVVNARRFIAMLAPAWEPGRPEDVGIGNGSVWGCLAQSVWALRRHDTYAEVVVDVIELGQDTDTVACVAGAIAGARAGASTIPAGWSGPVHGVVDTPSGTERYGVEELATIALVLAASSGCSEARR
jgi:ADP-ribosyl-[dinitrogen reductase] hydrolase